MKAIVIKCPQIQQHLIKTMMFQAIVSYPQKTNSKSLLYFSDVFWLFICLFLINEAYAQSPCDNYVKSNSKITDYKKKLNSDYSNRVYNSFKKESLKAAEYLVACTQSQNTSPTKSLNASYQIGKFYLDGGDCSKAYDYFSKCISMRAASQMMFKETGMTYKQKIAQLMQRICLSNTIENAHGGPVREVHVTYAGKMGITVDEKGIQDLFKKTTVEQYPYSSDEIELLTSRIWSTEDTLQALTAIRKIVGDNAVFYFNPPYLFVDVDYSATTDNLQGQGQAEKNETSEYPSDDISINIFKRRKKSMVRSDHSIVTF